MQVCSTGRMGGGKKEKVMWGSDMKKYGQKELKSSFALPRNQ